MKNFYDSRSVTKLQSTTPNMQARNEPHLVQATQNQSLHTEPPKHSQVPQYDGRLTVFVRVKQYLSTNIGQIIRPLVSHSSRKKSSQFK